jgi:anti-sigma B factor antagonist
MQLDTKYDHPGVVTITPLEARVDAHVAPAFRTALAERIDEGYRHVVVNMEKVEFIDSSGLGALISALKRLGRDGDLSVHSLSPAVRAMFELTRLNRVIPITD